MTAPHRLAALAIAALALIAAACNTQSAFDLEVGQCYDSPTEETEVSTVSSKPCDEPHDQEVYAVFDYPNPPEDFPGESAMEDVAVDRCTAEFEPFVGTDYDSSQFDFYYLVPSDETWADGDREVVCSVFDPDGKLTGSVRGSGR